MSLVSTLKRALTQSASSTTDATEKQSAGAYWCDDCNERILDSDAASDDPACPSCGESMRFERSTGTAGCAC